MVKDEIEALSQKEAISKIQNMGYFPTKVQVHGVKKKAACKGGGTYEKGFGQEGKGKTCDTVCQAAFDSAGCGTCRYCGR